MRYPEDPTGKWEVDEENVSKTILSLMHQEVWVGDTLVGHVEQVTPQLSDFGWPDGHYVLAVKPVAHLFWSNIITWKPGVVRRKR